MGMAPLLHIDPWTLYPVVQNGVTFIVDSWANRCKESKIDYMKYVTTK